MMARRSRYGVGGLLVHAAFAAIALFASPARAAGPLIWALGDSLTAGYGLLPNDGFTNQLQAGLRRAGVPATVKNGGVSGDTSAQGRARLLWGLRGLGTKPDLVIVELGANDMLRGLPTDQAYANLDAILAELKRRNIRVLIAGMKAPPNLGPTYRAAFDGMYPRLATQYGARLYPFFLDGVAAHRDLIQADGLHPNPKGVQIIVGKMVPVVKAALAE